MITVSDCFQYALFIVFGVALVQHMRETNEALRVKTAANNTTHEITERMLSANIAAVQAQVATMDECVASMNMQITSAVRACKRLRDRGDAQQSQIDKLDSQSMDDKRSVENLRQAVFSVKQLLDANTAVNNEMVQKMHKLTQLLIDRDMETEQLWIAGDECVGCGLMAGDDGQCEPSVIRRHDEKPRCNDCAREWGEGVAA